MGISFKKVKNVGVLKDNPCRMSPAEHKRARCAARMVFFFMRARGKCVSFLVHVGRRWGGGLTVELLCSF